MSTPTANPIDPDGITIVFDHQCVRYTLNFNHASKLLVENHYDGEGNPLIVFKFRPGIYTMQEDKLLRPTPSLSEHEQAEVDWFGIHDEDRGVW